MKIEQRKEEVRRKEEGRKVRRKEGRDYVLMRNKEYLMQKGGS